MKNDGYSISSLCNSCKKLSCCTDFFPPLLYSTDFSRLKNAGKTESQFIKNIRVNGDIIKTIKKKDNSTTCVFWNEERRLCEIYNDRPFDCRMFPFDVVWVNNEYHWIVYSCNPNSDWAWTEEYLKKLESDPQFDEMMRNSKAIKITSESTECLADIEEPPYVILRKINWKE